MALHAPTGQLIGARTTGSGISSVGHDTDDTGAPGGLSPAGVGASPMMSAATGALSGFTRPSNVECSSQVAVNAALTTYMQSTGRTAAAPAPQQQPARVQQQQQSIAAPMSAPKPASPAPAVAPQQQTPAQQAAHRRAMQQFQQNRIELPFSFLIDGGGKGDLNLESLQEGKALATHKFVVPMPQNIAGSRVMVTGINVHHGESNSRQRIGVRFGDVAHSRELTFAGAQNKNKTVQYNALVSSAGQPALTHEQTAHQLTTVVPMTQLMKYGALKSKEELLEGVEHSTIKRTTNVEVDSLIGQALAENQEKFQLTPVTAPKTGKRLYEASTDDIMKMADRIDREIIQNPHFQRALTDLEQFDVTLVPLVRDGEWTNVPELNAEPSDVRKKELGRNFTVLVQGTITAVVVPDNKSKSNTTSQ